MSASTVATSQETVIHDASHQPPKQREELKESRMVGSSGR